MYREKQAYSSSVCLRLAVNKPIGKWRGYQVNKKKKRYQRSVASWHCWCNIATLTVFHSYTDGKQLLYSHPVKIYATDDSGIWLPLPEEMSCMNGETFSIASPSGISGVGRLPDGTTEIYTATGMKVGGYEGTAPLPKGMYILRRGGKTVKVCMEK